MKKTKILMTTLAVATLAVGCGVLAACGGNEDTAYDITFDANGGTYAESATTVVVKTDKDGRIAQSPADPTREGGVSSRSTAIIRSKKERATRLRSARKVISSRVPQPFMRSGNRNIS